MRIEDTDRVRSKPEFEEEILRSLKWLGLAWDEPPVLQSGRLEKYREALRPLLEQGLAYEEKTEGKTAVKFKMPSKKAVFQDLVHGEVQFDTSLFEDLVLMKSDGSPTYHWACVVDDHDMQISHVIRGDDHLPNTPKHILLFEALGWKPPQYAHLPLILANDGTPLSKRHGAVSLSHYQGQGYLPEGLLNYLALLGWGTEGNQELFSSDELIKKFSLKRINKANARFNPEKLAWINAQHLKKLTDADYLARMTAFYDRESKKFSPEKWKKLVLLYRGRMNTLAELRVQASYCFQEIERYEPATYEMFLNNKSLKRHLEAWLERMTEISDFDDFNHLEQVTRETAQGWGIEARDLIHPLRFALTGKTVSPGLFELMSVLGKETCLARVRRFLKITA